MKTLTKIILDKVFWFIFSLFLLAITFTSNLNSRVNALESNSAVKEVQINAIKSGVESADKKLSKVLCMMGEKSEC